MNTETAAYLKSSQPRDCLGKFDRADLWQLSGYYGVILGLHVLGWGLYLYYSADHPAMIGLGLVAYLFGLRHAFDADHIAAVDDTVRLLMQQGKKPLGVGFFFSLGHSTIVFLLAVFTAISAGLVKHFLPSLESFGNIFGTLVSGAFLLFVGLLNLAVLMGMLKIWRERKSHHHNHDHIDQLLAQRGLLNRVFGGRVQKFVRHSWQMYPVGFLFGLGFDTASEVGLLALTAGAATGNFPMLAVLSLPILFTAGMSAMDTTDGVLMVKAYGWAFINPVRKIFYNITTTSLSVLVALLLGGIELLQVLIPLVGWQGPVSQAITALDFGDIGYFVVGLFVTGWLVSVAIWKWGGIEQAVPASPTVHDHVHTHSDGVRHGHRHLD